MRRRIGVVGVGLALLGGLTPSGAPAATGEAPTGSRSNEIPLSIQTRQRAAEQ